MNLKTRIVKGTPKEIMAAINSFLEPKRYKEVYVDEIVARLKVNIATRFDQNRVGGTWTDEKFLQEISLGESFTYWSPDGQEIDRRGKIGLRMKSLFRTSGKRWQGLDKYSKRKGHHTDEESSQGFGGVASPDAGGEKPGLVDINRPTREDFVDNVKDAILQEPIIVNTIEKTSRRIVIRFGFGNSQYMKLKTELDFPLQVDLLRRFYDWNENYMAGYYTWHIQEFGSAERSTSVLHPNVKKSPYPWILVVSERRGMAPYLIRTLYHRGRRGRHFYLTPGGTIYSQDYESVRSVLQSRSLLAQSR